MGHTPAKGSTTAKKDGPTPKRKSKAPAVARQPLAWQQFQELNFSFYEEHPSDFINMRIEVLSLMLCSEEVLAPAYATQRRIKGVTLGSTTPPDPDKRKRYLQTEAVVLLHHAAELLLRLFYAHTDPEHKECPWMGVASLTNFAAFKEKVATSLDNGFDPGLIAEAFLGGTSATDAGIALSQEEFDDAVDGLALLLDECARRLLSEAFLYNAIKHGLSTISLHDDTVVSLSTPGMGTVIGHQGPMFAYMHRARRPGDTGNGEWFVSMTGATTESDLALAVLIGKAVESLWDVGRRRYTGKSGSINYIRRSTVETMVYGLRCTSLNVVETFTFEMPRLNDDGSIGGTGVTQELVNVPEDYQVSQNAGEPSTVRVNLPARQRDQRAYSTSTRKLYPFSPNGSQKV
ncbi:MAG: hypothetical protein E6R06_08615 [Mycobacterium sp.]|nr:MAG: hypothetical protein E6R06_08615 [Mycobacterium sp.]